MKTKKETVEKKLLKGFKFNASIDTNYGEQPLFKEKVERANRI
jgi:hypothetical protein